MNDMNHQSPELEFLTFYISLFAELQDITTGESYAIFNKYGVINFLVGCYEPLHTQSSDYVLIDIVNLLVKEGYFETGLTHWDIIPKYKKLKEASGV